ncbi:MAG: hypothetical protein AB7K36_31995, partial [Chloroflexota bacterium]
QDDETGDWRLILSSPALTKPGSRRVYNALVSVLRGPNRSDVDIDSVRVLSPSDGVIQDLKQRVYTSADLQDIRLDGLYLGDQSYRAARIYRVMGAHMDGQRIERGARVRVKATGQLGTVHGIVRPPGGPRYLVLYDIDSANVRSLGEEARQPVGQDFAADELDVLYVIRSVGWPERNPDWLLTATGVSTFTGTAVAAPPDQN